MHFFLNVKLLCHIKKYKDQYPRKPAEITVFGSFPVTDHVSSSLILNLLE